ncbi:MAG: rod-binding protein [Candidatus Sericytochromatia bacterium]|nr:rod-binding protein [Candidatus Tanganyikabacteria bacterium]
MSDYLAPLPASTRVIQGSGLERSGLGGTAFGPPLLSPEDAKLDPERRKLKVLSREFEAVMVGQILSAMRATHLGQDLLGKGQANKIFRDMLDQQTSREMARRSSLGFADSIYRELVRTVPPEKPAKVAPSPVQGLD